MVYPGYQLNPGDMFQVDPERVLHATGAAKGKTQRRLGRKLRAARDSGEDESTVFGRKKAGEAADEVAAGEANDATLPADSKTVLQQLLAAAKSVAAGNTAATARQKQDLRHFTRLVRSTLSQANRNAAVPDSATEQLDALMQTLNIAIEPAAPAGKAPPGPADLDARLARDNARYTDGGRLQPQVPTAETQMIKTHEHQQLQLALAEARNNPLDAAKPYATPWRPRPWMSAFAFIPRYLEVHHRICSAVYLRHPVARPGRAEVPTPFDGELLGLSFNWYLRRR